MLRIGWVVVINKKILKKISIMFSLIGVVGLVVIGILKVGNVFFFKLFFYFVFYIFYC